MEGKAIEFTEAPIGMNYFKGLMTYYPILLCPPHQKHPTILPTNPHNPITGDANAFTVHDHARYNEKGNSTHKKIC